MSDFGYLFSILRYVDMLKFMKFAVSKTGFLLFVVLIIIAMVSGWLSPVYGGPLIIGLAILSSIFAQKKGQP